MGNYVIKSRALRIWLQSKGLDCKVIQDRNNPTHDVYLFNNSEYLQQLMTEYMALKQSR